MTELESKRTMFRAVLKVYVRNRHKVVDENLFQLVRKAACPTSNWEDVQNVENYLEKMKSNACTT